MRLLDQLAETVSHFLTHEGEGYTFNFDVGYVVRTFTSDDGSDITCTVPIIVVQMLSRSMPGEYISNATTAESTVPNTEQVASAIVPMIKEMIALDKTQNAPAPAEQGEPDVLTPTAVHTYRLPR